LDQLPTAAELMPDFGPTVTHRYSTSILVAILAILAVLPGGLDNRSSTLVFLSRLIMARVVAYLRV
jgi:hypothetical protein